MKHKILFLSFCLACTQLGHAKHEKNSDEAKAQKTQAIPFKPGPYTQFQSAVSFSMKARVKVPTPEWDPSPNGYNDTIGTSPMYGIAFGYQFLRLIRSDISVEYRPAYSYKKFQRGTDFDDRNREFNLSNLSLLLNGYLCFDGFFDSFYFPSCRLTLSPFIGVGLGVAYNEVRSFHSVSRTIPRRVFSMMSPKLTSYVAAQASAGLDFKLPHWAFGFGYRFFYGGKFKSENYVLDNPIAVPPPDVVEGITIKPWKGQLLTNEVFGTLRYYF